MVKIIRSKVRKAQEGVVTEEEEVWDPEMLFLDRYNTPLTKIEQVNFQKWIRLESKRKGRDIMMDKGAYDIQGSWKAQSGEDGDGHGLDTWKKPNHPTFSNESMYHGVDGYEGGSWGEGGEYTPTKQTLKWYPKERLIELFEKEPGREEHLKGYPKQVPVQPTPSTKPKPNKLIPKAQKGIKTEEEIWNDMYTRGVHAVETYGGSAVGDFIGGFSTDAAKAVDKWSGGMVPYTTQEQLNANRSTNQNAANNRLTSAQDAANAVTLGVATGGIGKAAMPYVSKYVSPILKKVKANFYKVNPVANKKKMQYLYRVEEKGHPGGFLDVVEKKDAAGEPIDWWLHNRAEKLRRNIDKTPEEMARLPRGDRRELAMEKYDSKWMETDPDRMQWYINDKAKADGSTGHIDLRRVIVPKEKAAGEYALKNNPLAEEISLSIPTERIVPRNIINKADIFPASEASKLIKDGPIAPHWLKGYPKPTAPAVQGVGPSGSNIPSGLLDEIFRTKQGTIVRDQTEDQMENILKHYNTPEGRRRLEGMGLDPDEAIKRVEFAKERISTDDLIGSHYDPMTGRINMDPKQLDNLSMSVPQVAEHEVGHAVTPAKVRTAPIPKADEPNFLSKLMASKMERDAPLEIEKALKGPGGIRYKRGEGTPISAMQDYTYFRKEGEPFSHMLEYRQGMLDRNIIKNRYDKIGDFEMGAYRIADPDSRINGFTDWNDENSRALIKKWVNKLPAVIGGTGAGYGVIKNE